MHAHAEWHDVRTAVIRVGAEGWQFGDPDYQHSMTLVLTDPPEIKGFAGKMTRALYRAVQRMLYREGIPRAVYRRADGRIRWIEARE